MRESGTGQQVTQLHDRYVIMMMMNFIADGWLTLHRRLVDFQLNA
jgi:hypothetical protein